MLTVNLESKLIKANKKILNEREFILVSEYEKNKEIANNEKLNKIGLGKNISEGRDIKNKSDKYKSETLKFNQERVFHISQIEDICNKYALLMRRAEFYNSTIDKELPNKITQFELAYDVTVDDTNSFIVAPHECFKEYEKDLDPLFFYMINTEYFYLVHKWGNDLSIFRRLIAICSNVASKRFMDTGNAVYGTCVGFFTTLLTYKYGLFLKYPLFFCLFLFGISIFILCSSLFI